MRAVLTVWGTQGDVGPLVGIAHALLARGHEVVMVTNPFFRLKLEAEGLEVRDCGPWWDPAAAIRDPRLTNPHTAPFRIWKHLFVPLMRPMFDAVNETLDEAPTDIVVNHTWSFGSLLAAEARGVPWAMVGLCPLTWHSAANPSLYGPARLPSWLHGWAVGGPLRFALNAFFSRSLRKICRDLGVTEHRELFFTSMTQASMNLALWSPAFRPPASDDPESAVFCGFPWGGRGRRYPPLSNELETFLDEGSPPVVVGLGSALPGLGTAVYRAVASSCQALGLRAILVGATQEQVPAPPPGIVRVPYAPYVSLFPRASVVVHHGGIGSTAEALCSGRPTIIVPRVNDAFDNAWRAERLGGSLTVDFESVNTARMSAALHRCLEDLHLQQRATELGTIIEAEPDGAIAAAEALIERFG